MHNDKENKLDLVRTTKRWPLLLKRTIDLLITIPLLILFAPFFLLLGIIIKLESEGPIFFRQNRLGFYGKVFRIFKFLSILTNLHRPVTDSLHKDDPRITSFGNILRKYRLDELPQLINVLKGEMSLVGPRPLLPEFLDSYSEEDRRRMNLPPGMTGWQQVHGSATNSWEQRIALDLWYIDHWNIFIDFFVMFLTIKVVLKAETVYDKDGFQRSGIPSHSLKGKDEAKLPHSTEKD